MMTKDEQLIAIAERCGWVFVACAPLEHIGFWYFKPSPEQIDLAKKGNLKGATAKYGLPRYCDDLNAMHEAEKFLFEWNLDYYCMWVKKMRDNYREDISATAAQRAEMFCRTLWPERWL